MKKILLALAALMVALTMNAQEIIFHEDFDSVVLYDQSFVGPLPDGWTCYKADQGTNLGNLDYFTDAFAVINFSDIGKTACRISKAANNVPVDRWLISPAIEVTNAAAILEFTAANGGGAADTFTVYVSTTDNQPASFTETLLEMTVNHNAAAYYSASLAAYAGQTIYIAWRVEATNDYLSRIDDITVMVPDSYNLNLMGLDLPNYGYINEDVTIAGTIENLGSDTLTNFTMQYTVNGGEPVEQTVEGISVPYRGTYNFSFTTPMNVAEVGLYTIAVSVSAPNGEADTLVGNNSLSATLSIYDPATLAHRTVLVEQFTGNQCGWCPSGHDRLVEALASFQGDYVYVTHHAGYNQDALTNEFGLGLTRLYGGGTFAPAMCLDRTHFDASRPGPIVSIYGATATILGELNKAKDVPTTVDIAISDVAFDEATRKISGSVTGQFKGDPQPNSRLTVYIVEDSIVMTQSDYVSGTPQTQYRHMHTCRTSLTGVWGETPNVAEDGTFSYTIDYTLPAVVTTGQARPRNVPTRTYVVAFVNDYDSTDIDNCKVYNATKSAKLQAAPVSIDQTEVSVSLYPNPATDYVVLQAANTIEQVTLINTLGQVVYTNSQVGDSDLVINTTDLAAGLYIAQVRTAQGMSSQRFSVVR